MDQRGIFQISLINLDSLDIDFISVFFGGGSFLICFVHLSSPPPLPPLPRPHPKETVSVFVRFDVVGPICFSFHCTYSIHFNICFSRRPEYINNDDVDVYV